MGASTIFAWKQPRAAGILLHPTALPSDTGIGNFGKDARAFVDFLAHSQVAFWQMCPLGPTGFGDSPYQCFSAFAGNPYLIDWEIFLQKGLLSAQEVAPLRRLPAERVDFGALYERFFPVMRAAYARWRAAPQTLAELGDYDAFLARERAWLDPYAEFFALKAAHGGAPWWEWPRAMRTRAAAASAFKTADSPLARDADFARFLQFVFFAQFGALKTYAREKGVRLVGDIPIFAARDSADVWAHPEIFQLSEDGTPLAVAGVPPDYFSEKGQLWGNPLYDWGACAREDYRWWIARLRMAFRMYDVVRLDHFRGFESYWSVPFGAEDARGGAWQKGGGAAFFAAVARALPDAAIIAEDLGIITDKVRALRRETGCPGMAVLQFAFDGDAANLYLPHNLERACVVYSGTHDNDTARGWYAAAPEATRDYFRRYLRSDGRAPEWDLIHAAYKSVCDLAVVPLQDVLGLDTHARFNAPGQPCGNWEWRFTRAQHAHLNAFLAPNLADLAAQSLRAPKPVGEK